MGRVSALWNSCSSFSSQRRVRSYENKTAPFNIEEYNVVWKNQKYNPWNFSTYLDWNVRTEADRPPA